MRGTVAIDPYARLSDLLEAAATGTTPAPGRSLEPFAMDPWAVAALARATAGTIADAASRGAVLRAIGEGTPASPLVGFDTAPAANLSPAAAAWWRLWANRAPQAFSGLYRALPAPMRAEVDSLSPARRIAAVRAEVLVLDPADDTAYPPAEGRWLVQGN